MKEKRIPPELSTRRDKVKELYEMGYMVIDIARYFEVSTSCIRKSLEVSGLHVDGVKVKVASLETINIRLEERDVLIKSKGISNQAVWHLGFWRIPREFSISRNVDDKETALQKELRMIGIQPKEIREYMGYDINQVLKVSRPQKNSFFDEQLSVARQLYAEGWSINDLIEFCGIVVGKFINRNKERTESIEGLMKGYSKIAGTAKKLFEEYNEDDNITHQDLAKKYGITRRSVITYIQQYELAEGKQSIKKSSAGNRRKVKEKILEEKVDKEKFDEEKLKNYLILNDKKGWVFKENWTIEKVAQECEVTEITVSKYKNKLNGKNK